MPGISETSPDGATPVPVLVSQQINFRSALHPFENSRLILAVAASVVVLFGGLAFTISAIGLFNTVLTIGLPLGVLFSFFWVALQLNRARLLGNSIRVEPDCLPDVHTALTTVRQQLAYDRRVDVYVAAEATGKASWFSFLSYRVIVLEGDFAADLLSTGGQAGLRFILGSFIGALKARHGRILPIFLLLQIFDSVKFLALFLNPYLRATRYSGDQLGYLCSGDLKVAIDVVGKLLVGKDTAPGLGVHGVLDQVATAQTRLLPRFTQFIAQTPHLVNRYMNVLAFSARVAPQEFLAYVEDLSEDTRQRLNMLLAITPHVERQPLDAQQRPPDVQQQPDMQQSSHGLLTRRVNWLIIATVSIVAIAIVSLVLILPNSNKGEGAISISTTPSAPNIVVPASPQTAGDLFNTTDNGSCNASDASAIGHTIESITCSSPPYTRYFYKYQGVDADGWLDGIRSGTVFANLTLVDESNACYKKYTATYTGGDQLLYNTVLFIYRKTPFVAGVSGDARSVDLATLLNTNFYVTNTGALC